MCLNWWLRLPTKFPTVTLVQVVFMPNHMHGIIHLAGKVSLIDVMRWYKTMTTNDYIRGVKEFGWPAFERKLWHRSYWDDILYRRGHLENATIYIARNPEKG